MINAKLRASVMNLTQLVKAKDHVVNNHFVAQTNQGVGTQPNASTPASRIWYFMSMKSSTFRGTMVDEYPQVFIDEVLKVVDSMGVSPMEKAELASYKLKDVTQLWFEQSRSEKLLERGPVD
ncbi:hypothetical protein EJD97_011276 [Solanum chilense]|uniref:Gag-pol polyprotein n=1 Tax=Solanum chilense TaxID=4083 RepID=A0A6N2BKY2_SOLCI|nr:hypothetical protein EJD97_011276 [Solanum chilense]